MALVDKVLTKKMIFFPDLYEYYKMLEIFLENSVFKPFSCMGKKLEAECFIEKWVILGLQFAYGFVCLLSK